MANYTVTDTQMRELNTLISKAGSTTSSINAHHKEVIDNGEALPASSQRDHILWHTREADKDNVKQDETQQAMQQWHDAIVKQGSGTQPPGPTGPTEPPPGGGNPQTWDPIVLFETKNLTPGTPNVIHSLQAADTGRISVEVSGSPPVECTVGPKGVIDKAGRYSWGAGTTQPIEINAGEWCNWRYDAPQGGQNMRPQLMPLK